MSDISDIFSQGYQAPSQTSSSEDEIVSGTTKNESTLLEEEKPSTKDVIDGIMSKTEKYGIAKPMRETIKAKRIYDYSSPKD